MEQFYERQFSVARGNPFVIPAGYAVMGFPIQFPAAGAVPKLIVVQNTVPGTALTTAYGAAQAAVAFTVSLQNQQTTALWTPNGYRSVNKIAPTTVSPLGLTPPYMMGQLLVANLGRTALTLPNVPVVDANGDMVNTQAYPVSTPGVVAAPTTPVPAAIAAIIPPQAQTGAGDVFAIYDTHGWAYRNQEGGFTSPVSQIYLVITLSAAQTAAVYWDVSIAYRREQ